MGGPHTKTRRHSKVETELPAEIKTQVDRLLIEDATYEEIAEFLKKKGHDISKSSIGRYGKEYLNFYKRVRMIEDQAKTINSNAGEGLNIEEAASKAFASEVLDTLIDLGADKNASVKQLPKLMLAFSALQHSSVAREKFKAAFKKKADKAFKRAEQDIKKISKEEMLKMLKEEVYGLT